MIGRFVDLIEREVGEKGLRGVPIVADTVREFAVQEAKYRALHERNAMNVYDREQDVLPLLGCTRTDMMAEISDEYDFVGDVGKHTSNIESNTVSRADEEGEGEESPRTPRERLLTRGTLESSVENLRYVLEDVAVLLPNLDAERVVISADHGQAFGEDGYWSHPAATYQYLRIGLDNCMRTSEINLGRSVSCGFQTFVVNLH